MSEHIDPQGNPGTCRATTGECPYGQHFESAQLAREAFEYAASYVAEKQSPFERELWLDALDDLEGIEDSLEHFPFTVSGKRLSNFSDFIRNPEALRGNSRELAEEVARWSDYDEREEEGWPPYGVMEHLPVGSLVKIHAANTLELNGETYVFDYGFQEIDPNHDELPFVGTLEHWKRLVDKASVLGPEPKREKPVDPRSLSLPLVKPGDPNPLLQRALMEEEIPLRNGTKVRYLSVDQVRVAAVHYLVTDGVPRIHSLETRKEYRNQGYMKKLLSELSEYHGGAKPISSGSMTHDGLAFTSHLTAPPTHGERKVNFPDYGIAGEGTFSFVHDWVTGFANGM